MFYKIEGTFELNTNYQEDEWSASQLPRVITSLGLVGGSAIADTEMEVFIGNQRVANLYNSDVTISLDIDNLVHPLIYVPPNAKIIVKCVDAAPANAVFGIGLSFVPRGMMFTGGQLISKKVAAATAVLGYNWADGEDWEESKFNRVLKELGFAGSTAHADCAVEVGIDGAYMGTVQVQNVGASKVPLATELIPFGDYIRAGSVLKIEQVDDGVQTQDGVLMVNIHGAPRMAQQRRTYQRRSYRRRY